MTIQKHLLFIPDLEQIGAVQLLIIATMAALDAAVVSRAAQGVAVSSPPKGRRNRSESWAIRCRLSPPISCPRCGRRTGSYTHIAPVSGFEAHPNALARGDPELLVPGDERVCGGEEQPDQGHHSEWLWPSQSGESESSDPDDQPLTQLCCGAVLIPHFLT